MFRLFVMCVYVCVYMCVCVSTAGFLSGGGGEHLPPFGFGLPPLGNFILSVNHFTQSHSKLNKSYLATS